jgi:hypothetical protein
MIVSNAAIVPAIASYAGAVNVYNDGPAVTDVIIDMNGYFAAPSDLNYNTALGSETLVNNTTGSYNTAAGADALQSNTTGMQNTATGAGALLDNTTGGFNTAAGSGALSSNSTGSSNTATGAGALQANTTGGYNPADGGVALNNNTTGTENVASGDGALQANTTGSYNTAIGESALSYNTTGGANIAIGSFAATDVSKGNSNNIHIGSLGEAGDSGVIRIGSGSQTSFFAAGITGTKTGLSGAVAVLVDSNGQLGTSSSSRRYKEDIRDMGEASSDLMRLRPVTFRYKQPYADGSKPVDYGLIAEEVAEVYPGLVARTSSGEVETVQYQKVNAMLLNEVQKQHRQIEEQDQRAQAQQAEMSALKARLSELELRLETLAAPK